MQSQQVRIGVVVYRQSRHEDENKTPGEATTNKRLKKQVQIATVVHTFIAHHHLSLPATNTWVTFFCLPALVGKLLQSSQVFALSRPAEADVSQGDDRQPAYTNWTCTAMSQSTDTMVHRWISHTLPEVP